MYYYKLYFQAVECKEGVIEGNNMVLVVFAHHQETFIHAIQHKPDCSTVLVRHDCRSLHLNFLCGVMKVNGDQAWRPSNYKVKLE